MREEGSVKRSHSNEDAMWMQGGGGRQEGGECRDLEVRRREDTHPTRGTFTASFYKNLLNKSEQHREQQEKSALTHSNSKTMEEQLSQRTR